MCTRKKCGVLYDYIIAFGTLPMTPTASKKIPVTTEACNFIQYQLRAVDPEK